MNPEEENIEEEKIKTNATSSFSFGTGTVGQFKVYFDISKPLDEVQKDLDKALKVLSYLKTKGYCIPR